MKKCSKCKTLYILVNKNFSKDRKNKNNFYYWCKKCVKKHNQTPKVKERKKLCYEKYKLEHGETWVNKWQRENREKVNKNHLSWYYKNHERELIKHRCRKNTTTLLKQRNIDKNNQECIVCGDKAIIHHNDYNNPFDIEWYCPYHHIKLHQLLKELVLSK